jgi:hypothetical protein
MQGAHNIFCPECQSVLDISKTIAKSTPNEDDGSSSNSNIEDDNIKLIIDKIIKKDDVENLLENINIDKVTNHEEYKKLDKEKKHIINEALEKYAVKYVDSSMVSYFFCKACLWSKKIKPGTQILSKTGGDSQTSYLNIDKYKNRKYSRILPFTRNYICPNDKCPGNKDKEKHEAVMYRINDTLKTMYTCCACQAVFNAQ